MSSTEIEASASMIFRELSKMSDDQMARVYDMLHDAKQRVVKKKAAFKRRMTEREDEVKRLINGISEQWAALHDETNEKGQEEARFRLKDLEVWSRSRLKDLELTSEATDFELYERAFDYVRNNGPYKYPASQFEL